MKCAEELVHCKDDFFVLAYIVHTLHLYFVEAITLLISDHIKLMDFVCIRRITARIDITFSLGVSLLDDTWSIIHRSQCVLFISLTVWRGSLKETFFLQALTITQCRQLIPFEYVKRAAACRSDAVHIYADDL